MTSYEYYTDTYFGNLIPSMEWPKFSQLALKKVDFYTFGRASKVDPTPKEVDFCVCEVADYLYRSQKSASTYGIASESTDGHSVTYAQKTQNQIDNDIWLIVRQNLVNSVLLYPGTNIC